MGVLSWAADSQRQCIQDECKMVRISSGTIRNIEPFLERERAFWNGRAWVVKTASREAMEGLQYPVGEPCQGKYACISVEGGVPDGVG